MLNPSGLSHFLYRHPWIRPVLWLLVLIWALYLVRGQISFVASTSWRSAKIITGWWWAVLKTLLVLAAQLCIAVPGTALAYGLIAHVLCPIAAIALSRFLDLAELPPAPPPTPRSFRYTHTHDNGEAYTHRYTPEEIEALREAMAREFGEEVRRANEREEREARQHSNSRASGKSKGKAKKRNRHA